MQSAEFSIKYVAPGIVRNGLCDMTDFCLIYEETGPDVHFKREAYFSVEGQLGEDGSVTFRARLPAEFKGVATIPWFSEWKNQVIHRMRDYILNDRWLLDRHGKISIEDLNS